MYTAARTLSTDNSNVNTHGQAVTFEEDEEQDDLESNEHSANANSTFDNNIMASEFLRMPRSMPRPGSRAYSVPANLGK